MAQIWQRHRAKMQGHETACLPWTCWSFGILQVVRETQWKRKQQRHAETGSRRGLGAVLSNLDSILLAKYGLWSVSRKEGGLVR